MLRWVPFAIVAVGLAACKHPSRLEGHWKGTRAEGVSGDVQAQANQFAAAMELEVKGDQIKVTTPRESQTGTFKVVKDENSTLVITTDKDGPESRESFTFVNDRTMKWMVMDGKTIVFEREAAPK
jgi:hypothetical protein